MKGFSTNKKFCSHFPTCSGCLFHPKTIPDSWKVFLENEELIEIEQRSQFIIGQTFFSRCKARLAVRFMDGKIAIGLFRKNSHDVVDIPNCQMHHPAIQKAVEMIKNWIKLEKISAYQEKLHKGLIRYLQLVIDRKTEKVQLVLICNATKKDQEIQILRKVIKRLFRSDEIWHSIWLNFQPKQTNTILGQDWIFCEGEKYLWQEFLKKKTAFLPGAFVQAHLSLFEKMVQRIKDESEKASSVLELFGGVGAIGLSLEKAGRRITIVENNPYAYKSFCKTKETYSSEVEYILEDVNTFVEHRAIHEELVIVDPPRKGLSDQLIASLAKGSSKKLVYVSCNEQTFLQDVKKLCSMGWKITICDGYMFFPGTERFEVFAILEKQYKQNLGERI